MYYIRLTKDEYKAKYPTAKARNKLYKDVLYDELADKLKEAKNLYPELTKAYNKYIEALRKGTAIEDHYLEFMKSITDAD